MNAPAAHSPAAIEARHPVEAGGPVCGYARAIAVLVLALGVLGAVPGITSNYSQMGFYYSEADLFGLFRTSAVVIGLQVLFGLTVLAFSGSPRQAHKVVTWVALAYLSAGLGGAGLVVNASRTDLPVNVASNWLHLGLFVVILAGAWRTRRKHVEELGVF
ncbi:DUF4383 domain-containing protein [Kineococcus sp. TBRC 1896]|uniref:DUF4383 domain-containing protein n=1 Tax=Kineococcus mangrovi TaxID=1660183 RepID=A0ABV4HZ11_9ACTN